MRRLGSATRFEIRTQLARKGFWITTFALPVAFLIFALLLNAFMAEPGGDRTDEGLPDEGSRSAAIGYVDEGGILHTGPPDWISEHARPYGDEQQAQEALAQGDIDRYYLIPADYVSDGELTVVQRRFQPLRAIVDTTLVTFVINTGLTGDEGLARLLAGFTPPPRMMIVDVAEGGEPGVEQSAGRAATDEGSTDSGTTGSEVPLAYVLMFILYMALVMTGGYLLQSVSKEKENRTAEMLLTTLSPRSLMLGKIGGLFVVGLLQVVIWLAVFFAVVKTLGGTLGVELHLGGQAATGMIAWTVGYFFFGYLMYSSLFAAAGVLAPTSRDAAQLSWVAIVPLMIPVLFNSAITGNPDGSAARILSLFPLTSPVTMVARLGASAVSWWEATFGLVVLAVFAALFALLAAHYFKAENVLSTKKFSLARLREGFRSPSRSSGA